MKAYLNIFIFGTFLLTSSFAQLESIGPEGGYIQCMVADNQENILVGIRFGGIYKTTNFGEEWTQIFYGYRNLDVRSLAVNSSNHYFAGTDETGLFRSTDQGATWEKLNNITAVRTIQVLLITPNGDIYAGTFDGVYKSTDNGNTFLSSSNGITTSLISSLAFASDYLFAGTYYAGIFRSGDGGESWNPINTGLDFNGRIVESIAFFGENNFANKSTTTSHAVASLGDKVYASNDIWDIWSPITPPPGNVRKIKITPVRNETHIVGAVTTNLGGVISISINDPNGSWNQENAPERPCGSLVETESGFVVGYQGIEGVNISTDGFETFQKRNNGLTGTSISAMKIKNGILIVGTETGEVLISTNSGNNWDDNTYNLPGRYINDVAINPVTGIIYAVDQYYTYKFDEPEWTYLGFFSQKIDFNNSGIGFSGYGENVNISNDDFQTHTTIFTNAPGVKDITFDNNDIAYIAATNQFNSQSIGVLTANPPLYDNWIQHGTGLENEIVTSITFVDHSNSSSSCVGDIFAGTKNGGLFVFINGQYTEYSDGIISANPITSIVCVNVAGNSEPVIEFAQGNASYYSSLNCNSEELLFDDDEFITYIQSRLLFNSKGKLNTPSKSSYENVYMYYGTRGTGVLRKDLLNAIENPLLETPTQFSLSSNYPNPFNPSTTIEFAIPEQSFVKLEVFNTLGEKVTTLVSEELNAGSYKFNWDAENLPSGVYLYKMQTTNFSTSRKMILIK